MTGVTGGPLKVRGLALLSAALSVALVATLIPAAAAAEEPLRPFSGTVTVQEAWSGRPQVNFAHAWTWVEPPPGDVWFSDINWTSCSGSETVTIVLTGDGKVDQQYQDSIQPFHASVDYEESCTGFYEMSDGNGELITCYATGAASSTESHSATLADNYGFEIGHVPDVGWAFGGAIDSADYPPVQASVSDTCGNLRTDPLWASLGLIVTEAPGTPWSSLSVGTRLQGTKSYEWADSTWTDSWDLTFNGFPPTLDAECSPQPTPTQDDSDGDRLPDHYETERHGTDPADPDTDDDCFSDAVEVATGSSPLSAMQTPDTLPAGTVPTALYATGDSGITCGQTRFKWVTPALESLGVKRGQSGCILMISNSAANAILDRSFELGVGMTKTLATMLGPYLVEVYGDEALDWAVEAGVDASVWQAKRAAKTALLKALNLTRINAVFTAGQVAGLAGVALGTLWGIKQVRQKNACIQVRIGTTPTGRTKMSWSLVYSKEYLTSAGLKDELHKASVWKKKLRRLAPDTAVRKTINLTCEQGNVVASGGSAGAVFNSANSFVF